MLIVNDLAGNMKSYKTATCYCIRLDLAKFDHPRRVLGLVCLEMARHDPSPTLYEGQKTYQWVLHAHSRNEKGPTNFCCALLPQNGILNGMNTRRMTLDE